MAAVILEPKKRKNKSVTVPTVSPSICYEVMGLDAMILVFWMLSSKPFSLSSFTFRKLFSSSSLSAIRVVSSAYLRLLIFLTAILIPACASSSPAFLMLPRPCSCTLLTHTSTADAQAQFSPSFNGVPWPRYAQGLPEPPECPCQEWGLILNANLPLQTDLSNVN